jgi:hypothetical protein
MIYRFDQFEADDREFRRPDAEMRMHVEPKVLRLLVYSSIYMNCAYSASLAVWRRSHGQISTEKRPCHRLNLYAGVRRRVRGISDPARAKMELDPPGVRFLYEILSRCQLQKHNGSCH